MFDDTKKELKELESQLLAGESREESMLDDDFATFFDEIKAEYIFITSTVHKFITQLSESLACVPNAIMYGL